MTLILGAEVDGWRAAFAWTETPGGPGLTARRFRRRFTLESVPDSFPVHVSADGRYILWVNGTLVGRGPLRGTLEHYHYETYDLAPCLRPGHNVLAARVLWFGINSPTNEIHGCRPGFLFQGPEGAGLDTPGEWKVQVDRAIEPDTTSYIANAVNFLGYMEKLDAAACPAGWREVEFDDSSWEQAVETRPADVPRLWGEQPRPNLQPRDVPMLVEEPRRFARTIRDGREVAHLFGPQPAGWTLPAGQAGEIVLDAGCLTTGYPVLSFRGGAGRTVHVTYSECMFQPDPDGGPPKKGIRDDIANGVVFGYRDTIRLAGGAFTYEPFHWRTFWFVQVSVSAGPEPVTLEDFTYRFTTYPQQLVATFESSDPDSSRMFEQSWRTLQLCSHETYEDCPYYEQLQYIGDTRLESLCSMALAGQSDLVRRAIRLYRDSTRPDGLVHSRVPSARPQILPYFALLWVLMVEDFWLWQGPRERSFIRSCLNAVDGVLWFFRERLRDDGFVGHVPHWNMVDKAEGWHVGEPPAIVEGASTYLSSLYVRALEAAVRLHTEAGEPLDAERWKPVTERVRQAVRAGAWSESEGLFLEGPGRTQDRLSQHSQVMAILADVATADQTRRILQRLTTDPSLHRMKLMQSYYLARALEKAGAYEAFPTYVLEPWREMLALHMSTWGEYLPGRSDCHAWSSWIAVDFLTCVLGIKPARPGFEEILIRPQTDVAEWARGSMPTPMGTVEVAWEKDPETGTVSLSAVTPVGVPTTVELPGLVPRRFPAGGPISISGPGPER